jgi:hypothetical protein
MENDVHLARQLVNVEVQLVHLLLGVLVSFSPHPASTLSATLDQHGTQSNNLPRHH